MSGRLICFVCGSPGADVTLRIRQQDRDPYFPFLVHHEAPKGARLPGSDGLVDSCIVCYMFLTKQWESYERSKTPAVKRLYWLKRCDNGSFTGAEMRIQGEYIAQVMGLQYPPGLDERGTPDSNVPSERDYGTQNNIPGVAFYQEQGHDNQSHEQYTRASPNLAKSSALDLSKKGERQPQTSEGNGRNLCYSKCVCFICGQMYKHTSNNNINILNQGNGEPFFPILEKAIHQPEAEYTSKGQVKACNQCKTALYQQWQAYEMSGIEIAKRKFRLPSQADGVKHDIKSEERDSNNESASTCHCYICGCPYITDHVRLLNTLPPKRSSPTSMFFPFVRELKRPSGAEPLRSDGTVIVCIKCYGHLSYQWEIQEDKGLPLYHRQYSLHFLSSGNNTKVVPSETSDNSCEEQTEPLNIHISNASPMLTNRSSNANFPQGLLAIALQTDNGTKRPISRCSLFSTSSPAKHHDSIKDSKALTVNASENVSSATSKSIPHPLQQVTEIPHKVCFLCAQKCIIHKMKLVCSYPSRHEAKHNSAQTEPFFPFLANRDPAPGAESLTEDGTVIVCKLCFYSLLRQWAEYERSPVPGESNRWLRKYCLPIYVCYVCGVENDRKFMRTIVVENFNFLKELKAPKEALVIDEGKRVVVCKSCAYSLMQQLSEFERMGVPQNLRKYNWMQKHVTEVNNAEDGQDHNADNVKSKSLTRRQVITSTGSSPAEIVQQGPLGLKPASSNIMNPAASAKHQRNTATVSPLHHVTSPTSSGNSFNTNTSLNASRTSSFAAALRKLAIQSKDMPEDSKTSCSPRDTTGKSGPPPLMYNSVSLTSPPVVTIAPTQSHPALVASESTRPTMERLHSNSSLFESMGSKADRPHSSASRDEDRALNRENHSQSAKRQTPHLTPGAASPMSARDEAPRGFQPYRPGDEMRPPLHPSLALEQAAVYSYPAAFLPPHAFPHPAFRFDDPLLMERYRMMHSPYLPYPQSLMPHPSLHPLLAAGARYPPDLFPPQFAAFSQPSRIPEHRSPSMMSERQQRIEEEKLEREKEKEREKEREMAVQRERQRALEREVEKQRDRLSHKECRSESSSSGGSKDNHKGSLSSKFGSIIQGTQKGLGIADRYPRVSTSSSSLNLSRKDEKRSSKEDCSSHSEPSSLKSPTENQDRQYSQVKPLWDVDIKTRSHPPLLVSPRTREEPVSQSSKGLENSLFRPFDSQQIANGLAMNSNDRKENISLFKSDRDERQYFASKAHADKRSDKDAARGSDSQKPRSSSTFHSIMNHSTKSESVSHNLLHPVSKDPSQNVCQGSYLTPLNIPSYSVSLLQSATQQDSEPLTSLESQNCISKLDMNERRLSESQADRSPCCSDSECDFSEEEQDKRKKLLISSGPPLKLDTSPKKIKLLSHLGLTTFSHKKDADFERCRKRRRRMRERSVSPVSIDDGPTVSSPLKTRYTPEDLCKEPDFKQRCFFLSKHFSLEPVSPDSRKVNEIILQACVEEKRRRLCIDEDSTDISISDQFRVKRKLDELDVFAWSESEHKNHAHDPRLGSSQMRAPSTSISAYVPCSSSIEDTSKRELSFQNSQFSSSVVNKNFVQEFHDSVLQTTRQKEVKKVSDGSGISQNSLTPHILAWQPVSLDLWPGVDVVMETYQKHDQGENLEKHVLEDRNRQLKAENCCLNNLAAHLSQRMEEMIRKKRQLEELRSHNQERIDHLKQSIRKLK